MKYCLVLAWSLLFPIFYSIAQIAETPKVRAIVKYKQIGYYDLLDVTYVYADDDFASYTINFDDFDVVDSPLQFRPLETVNERGSLKNVSVFAFAYTLRPKSMGALEIPPMQVKNKHGKVFSSKPLAIDVVSGQVIKANVPKPRLSLADSGRAIEQKAKKKKNVFLFSTGPVFEVRDTSMTAQDSALNTLFMDLAMHVVKNQKKGEIIGTYYWENMPRRYLVVEDTSLIMRAMRQVYSNKSQGIYYTNICAVTDWSFDTEIRQLENRNNLYKQIYKIKMQTPTSEETKTPTQDIRISLGFSTEEDRDGFILSQGKKSIYASAPRSTKEGLFYLTAVDNIKVKTGTLKRLAATITEAIDEYNLSAESITVAE